MPTKKHFQFSITNPEDTELTLVSLKDTRTGFSVRTALPNNGVQTASIMAFAGARYSRSDLSAEGLLKEIKESGNNANEKLANIFKNYGHASVADMAMLFAYIEDIPQIYAFKFFYETSLGGGQERSTRYQDFTTNSFVSLDNYKAYFKDKDIPKDTYKALDSKIKTLQEFSLKHYTKYTKLLEKEYIKVYDIDTNVPAERGALKARVFDSSRYFLLSGANITTSLAWITSGREWARIISILKTSKDLYLNYLGEQLNELFAPDDSIVASLEYTPEAPDLIRHTGSDETTESNIKALQEYLKTKTDFESKFPKSNKIKFHKLEVKPLDPHISAGTKTIAQYILSIYPNLNIADIVEWLESLPNSKKMEISKITLSNFTHHKQMGNQARVSSYSLEIISSIAEARDMNRHRAWGRFTPILSVENNLLDILYEGYTLPAYLTDNPKLKAIKVEFEKDLKTYYKHLIEFKDLIEDTPAFPKSLFLQFLPFAHICRSFFHGSVKELSYITNLRVRPGGHINYRILAYKMAESVSKQDIFIDALDLGKNRKPDPASRDEFINRS